jgi:hypothetical protein
MSVLAGYDDRCPVCDEAIIAGESEIVCCDDEWVHEECGDDDDWE